jgi:3-hydroxybutyryl-CoA dehydrogenase
MLAGNTSMVKITDIGKGVRDKERLVTAHWFNPPYLIPAVEAVKGAHTSSEAAERTVAMHRGWEGARSGPKGSARAPSAWT